MNDFTKEELERIVYCVDVVSYHEDEYNHELFDKIQSMIENYCEHDFPGGAGGSYTESFHESFKCKKCGKNYYD